MKDTHLSMVAFTRQRDRFRMYATEGDLEQIRERLGLDRLKANALEEGRFNAKPTALERFRGPWRTRSGGACQNRTAAPCHRRAAPWAGPKTPPLHGLE
ncbi:hypothetical protein [Luteibacter sp. 9145]|uniref:hypothetical protein n=1 Tax=Luteibacter sp. 9145 TaxID=1500892 RepID=UPI001EFC01C8|nr:hypothetical protein [Luteibacter sp. 9145]